VEARVNEEKMRQRNLLAEGVHEPLPKKVEEQALELLVQLLIAVALTTEEGRHDEQDHQ
jgi:hypothetical protein